MEGREDVPNFAQDYIITDQSDHTEMIHLDFINDCHGCGTSLAPDKLLDAICRADHTHVAWLMPPRIQNSSSTLTGTPLVHRYV